MARSNREIVRGASAVYARNGFNPVLETAVPAFEVHADTEMLELDRERVLAAAP